MPDMSNEPKVGDAAPAAKPEQKSYEHKKLERDYESFLHRCKSEIMILRRANESLMPRAEAYDMLCVVLRQFPRPVIGVGEDVIYRIDQELERLKKEIDNG